MQPFFPRILSSSALMPLWGIIIQFLAWLGLYGLLARLTIFFCFAHEPTILRKDGRVRILVMSHHRFRGDLDVLSASGEFDFQVLPFNWMCRILFTFYKGGTTFEDIFYGPEEFASDRIRLELFMQRFLPRLYKLYGVDAVVTAALHYRPDYLWGENSSKMGTPFIVFHRESFLACPRANKNWLKKWGKAGKLKLDLAIIMTNPARDLFLKSGVIDEGNSINGGTLRMDAFVKKYHNKKTILPTKKQVTLFSFTHGVGSSFYADLWYSPAYSQPGFAQMFEYTHSAFAELAIRNPNVTFVIKTKWEETWFEEIDKALLSANIERKNVPNLKLTAVADVHSLIEESNVVCGYGSTTLLETSIIGDRPIIVPLLGEAQSVDYHENLILPETPNYFDTARTKQEFIEMVETAISGGLTITKNTQTKRESLFEKWSSFLDGSSEIRFKEAINKTLSKKKTNAVKSASKVL